MHALIITDRFGHVVDVEFISGGQEVANARYLRVSLDTLHNSRNRCVLVCRERGYSIKPAPPDTQGYGKSIGPDE